MGSSRAGIVLSFIRFIDLCLRALQEPSSLPDWDVIGFVIGEAHIIHQTKNLF